MVSNNDNLKYVGIAFGVIFIFACMLTYSFYSASTVKKNGLEELQIEAKEIIGDESSPHGLVNTPNGKRSTRQRKGRSQFSS